MATFHHFSLLDKTCFLKVGSSNVGFTVSGTDNKTQPFRAVKGSLNDYAGDFSSAILSVQVKPLMKDYFHRNTLVGFTF